MGDPISSPIPIIDSDTICQGAEVPLFVPQGNGTFNWYTNNLNNSNPILEDPNVSDFIQSGDTFLPSVNTGFPGVYTFWLTQSIDGCESQAITFNLTIGEGACEILMPSAFSPNNDGLNDRFRVLGGNQVSIINRFSIFNRWGEEVFLASNFNLDADNYSWDGTFRNDDCDIGVYMYYVEVTYIDGNLATIVGNVTLVR